MTADDIRHWVDGYRAAWEHNDPTAIGALFAPDATYRTDPFAEPWSGRDGIVEAWLAARDEPGQTEFSYEVLAVDGDLGVVEGRTTYHDTSRTYANVWLVRLDGTGACTSFTEYWMLRRAPS